MTPDEALERLREGNRRFVADQPAQADISTQRRLELAKGQQPFAALVGCADSRVGPEHLFGAGLGELFIVRTAGNYLDDAGFGSVAFAVSQLGVSLVVVLGHEQCGAVAAASAVVGVNAQLPPALTRMVQPILPAAIDAHARKVPEGDVLDLAIHLNVKRVVQGLREASDPIIGDPMRQGKVRIVGAYYDLSTGSVDFFDT
ncbi:MAG: carbonic anhydrase [Sphingomonadales bacterium]|nr:carbonic anhydrase [Sphingomonadaceae bacterium]MBS3929691.1 carbonic anhydrase [Sphingomonadales bacterium]